MTVTHKLEQHRANITEDQRGLVDHIWATYYQNKGNTWPTVMDTQIQLDQPRVLAALRELPPGTVYEEGEQYRIGLLGVLLTSTGPAIEERVVEYLDYARAAKRKDLSIVAIQSRDVAAALKLSEEETMMLASALHLGQLGGDRGAGGGPIWAAGIPREIAGLMNLSKTDLRAFVRDRAAKMADDLAAARAPAPPKKTHFWFVSDPELRSLLEADWLELHRVQAKEASKSSVLLSGGILEGMLLDVLKREQNQARAAVNSLIERKVLASRPPESLDRWDLAYLVAIAGELGIIPSGAIHLSHALREFRNLIHPGKQLRENVHLTDKEAVMAATIVDICIAAVAAYEERTTALPETLPPQAAGPTR